MPSCRKCGGVFCFCKEDKEIVKKVTSLVMMLLLAFASASYGLSLGSILSPEESVELKAEDALSQRSGDAVYMALKLEDTGKFLRWLISRENIDVFMPLILGSKQSNEILGGIEVISSFVQNTPLKSAAMVIGMNREDIASNDMFFQMAFTVTPEAAPIVRKVSDGSAEAMDFAQLLLGEGSPLSSMAESMIKAEREGEVYKLDNELYVKAEGGLVILGTSLKEVQSATTALKDEKLRLFGENTRRFSERDFALIHADFKTLEAIDGDEDFKPSEIFDEPLNVEFAFERLSDKFIIKSGINIIESMKKEYADIVSSSMKEHTPVKGGYIDLTGMGTQTPLAAFGGCIYIGNLKKVPEVPAVKAVWDFVVKQLRLRFGISEEEFTGLFTGPLSLAVNDNVTFEGFKIPGIYVSQTGRKGYAGKVFSKLSKLPHFHKVQDGILQLDTSISPISCFIQDKGEALGIYLAELSSITSDAPTLKPALEALMARPAVSSFWIDFAGIQSWLLDDENGVMMVLGPIAAFSGHGKEFKAFREVLGAELSVPSISWNAESAEVSRIEFAIAGIKPENGLISKLVKLYREFQD